MDEQVEQFLDSVADELVEGSIVGCRSDLNLFLDALAAMDIERWSQVRPEHLERWAAECGRFGRSTQRSRLHWTRRFLVWLRESGGVRRRLADALPEPPASARPVRGTVDLMDRERVLHADPEDDADVRALAVLWVASATGAKTAELVAMNAEDIDVRRKQITVRAGTATSATVDIEPACAEQLARWLAVRAAAQKHRRAEQSPALFISLANGARASHHTLQQDVRRIAAMRGVKGLTLSSLRNTAYVQFRIRGMSAEAAQRVMALSAYSAREIERSLRSLGPP